MLTFHYEPLYTKLEGPPSEIAYVRTFLTFSELEESFYVEGLSLLERGSKMLSGLIPMVTRQLDSISMDYEIVNEPPLNDIEEVNVDSGLLNGATLRDYQQAIATKALYRKRGLVISPTGSGKTIISAAVAKWIELNEGKKTLMVVPGVNSLHQMWSRWTEYGLKDVGRLGDGKKDLDAFHLLAVVNSLHKIGQQKKSHFSEWLKDAVAVQWMEVQHLGAPMWVGTGVGTDAPYRLGLSATPFSTDKPKTRADYTIIGMTGDPVVELSDSVLMDLGHMATPRVHFLEARSEGIGAERDWMVVKKKGVNQNAPRNDMIRDLAVGLVKRGRKVIILVTEISHGKLLGKAISQEFFPVLMYHGGSKLITFDNGREIGARKTPINELRDQLEEAEDGYVLIGSPAVDEDADFPDANVLILAGAGRAYRRVIQRSGRVLRSKPGENTVDIIDFNDKGSFVLKNQAATRRKFFLSRYSNARDFKALDYSDPNQVVRAICGNLEGGDE
jgi:superfamily II DNA or RNA helicase